jgi:hypothetical protein
MTLYNPLEDLPQVDSTVQLRHGKGVVDWKIKADGVWYIGKRLRSSPAYGKQTFVWTATQEGGSNNTYIIKDCWANSSKRYREVKLYEKVWGVRGFAQKLMKEGKGDEIEPELTTSALHSGENSVVKCAKGPVPIRKKERIGSDYHRKTS